MIKRSCITVSTLILAVIACCLGGCRDASSYSTRTSSHYIWKTHLLLVHGQLQLRIKDEISACTPDAPLITEYHVTAALKKVRHPTDSTKDSIFVYIDHYPVQDGSSAYLLSVMTRAGEVYALRGGEVIRVDRISSLPENGVRLLSDNINK